MRAPNSQDCFLLTRGEVGGSQESGPHVAGGVSEGVLVSCHPGDPLRKLRKQVASGRNRLLSLAP